MGQKEKQKFRASKEWKEFRQWMKNHIMVDQITLRPLYRGWNLHHMDGRPENYTNIKNGNRFYCLNKQTHEVVHVLYRYYKIDKDILKRLKKCLDLMIKYSND